MNTVAISETIDARKFALKILNLEFPQFSDVILLCYTWTVSNLSVESP